MHLPPLHRMNDPQAILALIEAHPLGGWVCPGPGGLVANHVPFFLDRSRGPFGTLVGHVSRANAVWRGLDAATPSVVMFQGPQAYISPGWYPGHATHGEVVPTWNYVVAHAHGVAVAIDDRDRLLEMLNRLTDEHESHRPLPWQVSEAPAAFIDRLMRAVVGIEIRIDRLEGKHKLSQDEAEPDRVGTVQGLRQVGSTEATALADRVAQALERGEGLAGSGAGD